MKWCATSHSNTVLLSTVLLLHTVTDVTGWGGWDRIGGEISRAVSTASREVHRATNQVTAQADRFASQVERETDRLGNKLKKETDRIGDQIEGEGNRVKIRVGSWFNDEDEHPTIAAVPPAVVGCPPLISATVEFACRTGGRRANCSQATAVGTIAQLRCRQGYHTTLDWFPASVNCTAALKWSQPVYSCVPDCGKRNDAASGKLPAVEFPWHVTIYKLNATRQYEASCGGTLITPTLVISAATCFWDATTSTARPPATFKVAAGRPLDSWYSDDAASTQRRDVTELRVNDRYLGRLRSLANDVAIVRLSEEVRIGRDVNLVCVDWIHDLENIVIAEGSQGTVASLPTPLPFVPFQECSDAVPGEYQEYITDDKFCAGSTGNTVSVCSTDVGAAYTLPLDTVRGSRHYLRGIATAQLDGAAGECAAQAMAVFTHFAAYRKWAAPTVFNGHAV